MLKDGFVRLVDSMPSKDLDAAIVQAARVSYSGGSGTATRSDKGLIRYLMRHWHSTPFEMVEFKFHIKMPIFVTRQHMRHRTASINELSGRYSEMPEEFFVPPYYRFQSKTNKQSSEGALTLEKTPDDLCHEAFRLYREMLDAGCCRELARCHLPLSTFTEFYWKINLHNLLRYLKLRLEPGAQKEIQQYAQKMFELIEPLCPLTMEAFVDFHMGSIQLSRLEIEAICNGRRELENVGENREFQEKLKQLNLTS
jgi:thymidylate synthase (FAD)